MIRLRLAIAALFLAAGAVTVASAVGWVSADAAQTLFIGLWLFGGLPLGAWLLWSRARRK